MNILNISKDNKEVVLRLNTDELVKICNVLYKAPEKDKNNTYYQLYSNMMIARDLCQYGHIDNFCLECITECRNHIK